MGTAEQPPNQEPADRHAVTQLLGDLAGGSTTAQDELLELLYTELRALAGSVFQGQGPSHTLQPTALVHEAYLKLVSAPGDYNNRRHFMAVAAKAMRQILINHARDKKAAKRGGSRVQITMNPDDTPLPTADFDVLELEESLTRLESIDPDQVRVVELRFFGGLSVEETARVMGVSESTVKREWRMARAELLLMLEDHDNHAGA